MWRYRVEVVKRRWRGALPGCGRQGFVMAMTMGSLDTAQLYMDEKLGNMIVPNILVAAVMLGLSSKISLPLL